MARINEKHKPLYTSTKRYVYEKGGRGSGKSFAITDYAQRITYDKGRVVLFMRYTMVAASISIVPEFEEAMERENSRQDFHISGNDIVNKLTGSKIIFKGVKTSSLNQTANLKSIQGLTDVIYDEFEEHPDKESFDKLDESIRNISVTNKIVLVSNALNKNSWQYKEFWTPKGLYYDMTDHIHTTWRDNEENLSDSWHQKRLIVKEKEPKKYARDYDGKDYLVEENAFLYNFSEDKHIKEVEENPHLPHWFSHDFNVANMTAGIAQRVDLNTLYVFREIDLEGCADTYKIANYIKTNHPEYQRAYFTGDASGRNRQQGAPGAKSNWHILKTMLGITDQRLKVRSANLHIEESHKLCNAILAYLNIYIHPRCERLITDVSSGQAEIKLMPDGKYKLILVKDENNGLHHLDWFRYLLDANFPDFIKNAKKYEKRNT